MSHLVSVGSARARATRAALLLAVIAFPLTAGFDAWGGKALSFGDGTDTDANKAKIQALIDQLMKPVDPAKPFGPDAGLGLTQAQAEARVKEIRENVKKMVEIAKKRVNAERAKFLCDQFENGNICISWGMKARGTCGIDSDPAKKASEKIAIAASAVVGGPLECYSPAVVTLSATITHENTHAGQSYAAVGLPPAPTDAQKKAGKGKAFACNEVEAHGDNQTWKTALMTALCDPDNWDPEQPIPDGTDPAIAEVLMCLKDILNPLARIAAAAELKLAMKEEADADKLATECYTKAKNAFGDFIAGALTAGQLRDALNDARWKHYTSWLDSPLFVSEQLPETLTQTRTDVGTGPDIDTTLAFINDFLVWPLPSGGEVLLVIGEDGSGFGELQVYEDTNADLFFEEATRQVLFTGASQLQSNMHLLHDEATATLYAYDALDRLTYRIDDSDADDVPDQLGPAVHVADPLLDDYVAFEFVPGAPVPTILGYPFVDSMSPSLRHDELLVRLRDLDDSGDFETIDQVLVDGLLVWDPTFEPSTFGHLAPALDVYGPPGAVLQVWLTNDSGALLQPRGNTIGQGIAATASVNLTPPFQYGEQMVIVDVTHGTRSPNARLSPWEDLGFALGGAGGDPLLAGTGVLAAGQPFTLTLSNAAPSVPSTLIVGLSAIYAPLKGGTLVPAPLLQITLPTSTTGGWVLPAAWPPGVPPGLVIYLQTWLPDAGGPKGLAASNGLAGTTS